MFVKVPKEDRLAVEFVNRSFTVLGVHNGDTVTTFVCEEGGPQTVAVYSLQYDQMFLRGRSLRSGRRLTHSLYRPYGKPFEWGWEGASRKRRNRALRAKVQPTELVGCDLYLALNRDLSWKEYASSIFCELRRLTHIELPTHLRERGGGVVYTRLPYTRIVTPSTREVPATRVWYGTSGLYNLAELVLTIKAASHLLLPAMFDSYRLAVKASHNEAEHQRGGMRRFANLLMKAVGVQVSVTLSETAKVVLGEYAVWRVGSLARWVETQTGHPVVFLHSPDGEPVLTSEVTFIETLDLETLHRRGWWAGGALIYSAFYAQAARSPFVAIVFDGARGGVHLLAREQMQKGNLWMCPAGSFHIVGEASGRKPLGPWEFLDFATQWGEEKASVVLRQLWNLARVPLSPEGIGISHTAVVSLDGLRIEERRST